MSAGLVQKMADFNAENVITVLAGEHLKAGCLSLLRLQVLQPKKIT